jgi:phosphohistidine swiveling domain-containing protein
MEVTNRQIQDIEFTVENDRLYILQARTARCAPFAHLKSLISMKAAGEISAQDVLDSLTLTEYLDMNVRQVDPTFTEDPAASGLSGSLGALHARVVFGPSVKYAPDPTVFLAMETTPDDLSAIKDAAGVLTARGGVTSHAAVVARGMGKVCVVGCGGLTFNRDKSGAVESASLGGQKVFGGDWITLDAATGRVWVGREVPIVDASTEDSFIALEDLVMDLHPAWVRATSSIDDLRQDRPSVLATYAMDDLPFEELLQEMGDAVEFLTGTMDLTGRLDAMTRSHPDLFLCADLVASDVFDRKKEALLDVLKGLPGRVSEMVKFDLYLGPYEEDHSADFRSLGIRIRPRSALDLSVLGGPKEKSSPDALVAVRAPSSAIPDDRTVVSSRNALLSCLKR